MCRLFLYRIQRWFKVKAYLCIETSLSTCLLCFNFNWLPLFLTFFDFAILVLEFFFNVVLGEIVKAGHTEKHKIIKCLCYGWNRITQLGIQPQVLAVGILMSSGKKFPSTFIQKVHGHVSIIISVFRNNIAVLQLVFPINSSPSLYSHHNSTEYPDMISIQEILLVYLKISEGRNVALWFNWILFQYNNSMLLIVRYFKSKLSKCILWTENKLY